MAGPVVVGSGELGFQCLGQDTRYLPLPCSSLQDKIFSSREDINLADWWGITTRIGPVEMLGSWETILFSPGLWDLKE